MTRPVRVGLVAVAWALAAAACAASPSAGTADVGAPPAADAGSDGTKATARSDGAATDLGPADAAVAAPSKKPAACPAVTPPPVCFQRCQPPESAAAPATPAPAPCGEVTSGLLWDTADGKAPHPPSLQVAIGAGDVDSGAFVAYVDGQWAPIVEGVQGGVHVWGGARVKLPAQTAPKVVIEIAGHALLDCKPVATELLGTSKAIATADPSLPGWWTNAKAWLPGIPIAFEKNTAAPYCGQWVEVVVEVRDPKSLAWGRASAVVRLFELDNLP